VDFKLANKNYLALVFFKENCTKAPREFIGRLVLKTDYKRRRRGYRRKGERSSS
jgi:hypothetical protein